MHADAKTRITDVDLRVQEHAPVNPRNADRAAFSHGALSERGMTSRLRAVRRF